MTDQPPVEHPDPQPQPHTESNSHIDGGVNLENQGDVTIGGDVVGRDKIVEQELHAAGRTVIQIGKLNVPVIPLVAALGLALVVLIFIGAGVSNIGQQLGPTPTPGAMSSSNFNVAIAEFGAEDVNGKVSVTTESRALSKSVYDTLQAQRDAFPDPIIKSSIALRYGNLPLADDLIHSEADAARVVEQLGADMLIYGNLDRAGRFTPQFYISPRVRGEIDPLLTGQQNVGAVQFTSDASFEASTDLRTRASALFFIATGLTYDVFGRAARALEVYRQAEQTLSDWPEQGAGKEILYFFKGQAALFRAQQTTGQASADLLKEAEEAFKQALNSNPDYARALIGLGSANYVKVQRAATFSQTLDSPEWQTMLAAYAAAPELARKAGDRLAEQVGTFSQGQAAYQLGRIYSATNAISATQMWDKAITMISSTIQPFTELKQPRLVGQAYLTLGDIHRLRGNLFVAQGNQSGGRQAYIEAVQAYQACVDLGRTATDRILSDLIVRDRCQPRLKQVQPLVGSS